MRYVESISPPGVLMTKTTAGAPAACASAMTRSTYRALIGLIASSMCPTTTGAPGAALVTGARRGPLATDETSVRSVWPKSAPAAPSVMRTTASASWNVKLRLRAGAMRAASREPAKGVSWTRWVSMARASAAPRVS